MAKKIVHISKSYINLPQTESGYRAVVNDGITGEELYDNAVWSSSGGLTPFNAAISLWKSINKQFGNDLELDNTGAPEITIDFLNKGLNPQQHFAVIKNSGRDFSLEIHLGNNKLPIYKMYYTMHWSQNVEEIISRIKGTIGRYKNISLDISEAPSLKQYF